MDNAQNITKNASKHLDPLQTAYKDSSQYAGFISSLKQFDAVYAKNLTLFVTKLKELINKNLKTNTDNLKKVVDLHASQCENKEDDFEKLEGVVEKAFVNYVKQYHYAEDKGRVGAKAESDLWIFEHSFLKQAKVSIRMIGEMREMLFKLWEQGKELESERIKTVKTLYEDIVSHNQKIFGESQEQLSVVTELGKLNSLQVVNELYSFRALVTPNELKPLITLK